MAQINLRVDDEVKRMAERTLSDIGLSMAAAINVFLRKVAREGRIPFELSAAIGPKMPDAGKTRTDQEGEKQ